MINIYLGVILVIVFQAIILYRDNKIFKFRMKILRINPVLYKRIPSYNYIIWDLKTWDFNRYLYND